MSSYDKLQALTRFILPEDILNNFDIICIEQLGGKLHVHLNGQLILPTGYSVVTKKAVKGRKGTVIAIVGGGTKTDVIIKVLDNVPEVY